MRLAPLLLLAAVLSSCRSSSPSPSPLVGEGRGGGATLVDILALEPSIRLDIRYATEDNFTGKVVYPKAVCLLKAEAAEALARAHRKLAEQGLGLKVWDCYRPLSVQKRFWELVPDERYVANPAKGSRHNRGHAVDLTLVDGEGGELEMPTGYDDFSEKAHRGYPAAPQAVANAKTLEDAMLAEGFTGLSTEWWHFDYPGWKDAPVLDIPFP